MASKFPSSWRKECNSHIWHHWMMDLRFLVRGVIADTAEPWMFDRYRMLKARQQYLWNRLFEYTTEGSPEI